MFLPSSLIHITAHYYKFNMFLSSSTKSYSSSQQQIKCFYNFQLNDIQTNNNKFNMLLCSSIKVYSNWQYSISFYLVPKVILKQTTTTSINLSFLQLGHDQTYNEKFDMYLSSSVKLYSN